MRAEAALSRDSGTNAASVYRVPGWYARIPHGWVRALAQLAVPSSVRAVLDAVVRRFGGGPVGLSTLAVAVGEETETVETVAEPFLVRCGLLLRTPRGRVATPAAWQHLGLAYAGQVPVQDVLEWPDGAATPPLSDLPGSG